jgi:hypothetical protein
MDRLPAGAVVIAFLLVLLWLMYRGWRILKKRSADLSVPKTEVSARGAEGIALSGLYVATTRQGEPLARVAIPGLAFRGRVHVIVYGAGVLVRVTGEPEVFVAAENIRSVGTSTWTIDRVVETGGMVRLDWKIQSAKSPEPQAVESYLRLASPEDSTRLIEAVTELIKTPTTDAPSGQEGSLT